MIKLHFGYLVLLVSESAWVEMNRQALGDHKAHDFMLCQLRPVRWVRNSGVLLKDGRW